MDMSLSPTSIVWALPSLYVPAPQWPHHEKKSVDFLRLDFSADIQYRCSGFEWWECKRQRDPSGTEKYLLEHIRSRIANPDRMPHIVTFVEAYYDTSMISSAIPEGISISIPLLGFAQTRAHTSCEISTMQFWFPASWAPVPGGLSSNQEFKDNARRSEDPSKRGPNFACLGASAWTTRLAGSFGWTSWLWRLWSLFMFSQRIISCRNRNQKYTAGCRL